jgi:hypothetical protein
MSVTTPPVPTSAPLPVPGTPIDASALPPEDGSIPPPPLPPDPNQPAPPAANPFLVESTVASIGIEPFVTKTLKKVFLYHLDKAAKLGDQIDRAIYQFLASDGPAKIAPLPPFDFVTIRDELMTEPNHQHIADIIGAFGSHADTGMAAVQVAQRIQAYLVTKIPHRIHQSIAGPIQETPAHSDLARFRRIWNIACDPIGIIIEALGEYALSRDMVEAFSTMYPLVWQRVDDGITSQLVRKKGVSPKFVLTIRKEQQLRILAKKEDTTSKALGIALQAQFKKQAAAAAPKPPRAKASGSASIESTETDRIGG